MPADYCQNCGLLLLIDKERKAELCRFCEKMIKKPPNIGIVFGEQFVLYNDDYFENAGKSVIEIPTIEINGRIIRRDEISALLFAHRLPEKPIQVRQSVSIILKPVAIILKDSTEISIPLSQSDEVQDFFNEYNGMTFSKEG